MMEASSVAHSTVDNDFTDDVYDDVDGNDTDSNSDSDLSDSDYVCTICKKRFSGYIPLKQHEKGRSHSKAVLKKKREKQLLDKITAAENQIESNEDEESIFSRPRYAVCKPCGKEFGGLESYYRHIRSKYHGKKIQETSVIDQVRDNGEINVDKLKELIKSKKSEDSSSVDIQTDEDDMVNVEEFECKECDKSFSGLTPYIQHLTSKVHAKKVEKNKLLQKLTHEDLDHTQTSTKAYSKDITFLAVEDDILVCKLCSTSFSGPESAMMHIKSRAHLKNVEKLKWKQERKKKVAAEYAPKDDADDTVAAKYASTADAYANAPAVTVSKDNSDSEDESGNAVERKRIESGEKKESRRMLNKDIAYKTLVSSANENRGDPIESKKVKDPSLEMNSRTELNAAGKVPFEKAASENVKKCDIDENKTEDSGGESVEHETAHDKYKKYKEIMNTLKKDEDI